MASCIIFFMLASGWFPGVFFFTFLDWSVLVIIMLSCGEGKLPNLDTVQILQKFYYRHRCYNLIFHSCLTNEGNRENALFVYFISMSCHIASIPHATGSSPWTYRYVLSDQHNVILKNVNQLPIFKKHQTSHKNLPFQPLKNHKLK